MILKLLSRPSPGWFHSGDLGVMHDDDYIQLKDRSRDIIISGGENISSIEVENCLYAHPPSWKRRLWQGPMTGGAKPVRFVGLSPGSELSEQEVIDFCRENMAHYKVPKTVVFQELPKTSTGKVQKFKLREQAKNL